LAFYEISGVNAASENRDDLPFWVLQGRGNILRKQDFYGLNTGSIFVIFGVFMPNAGRDVWHKSIVSYLRELI